MRHARSNVQIATSVIARGFGMVVLLLVFCGCSNDPELPCKIDTSVSGAVSVEWTYDSDIDCTGYGPSTGDSIDMYFEQDYSRIRVRLDYVSPGQTGTFTDVFVSVYNEGDQWGSYAEVNCEVIVNAHDDIGEGEYETLWAVAGSVSCDAPLEPFTGTEGTVTVAHIEFESGYSD